MKIKQIAAGVIVALGLSQTTAFAMPDVYKYFHPGVSEDRYNNAQSLLEQAKPNMDKLKAGVFEASIPKVSNEYLWSISKDFDDVYVGTGGTSVKKSFNTSQGVDLSITLMDKQGDLAGIRYTWNPNSKSISTTTMEDYLNQAKSAGATPGIPDYPPMPSADKPLPDFPKPKNTTTNATVSNGQPGTESGSTEQYNQTKDNTQTQNGEQLATQQGQSTSTASQSADASKSGSNSNLVAAAAPAEQKNQLPTSMLGGTLALLALMGIIGGFIYFLRRRKHS